ncbi:MAG: chemoreceptor glutamine deamidase CheD, partial [Burkholderiales bacterium]|nr:chemoreceptor glutamine deamidase CheD [Burkholderiales bacterium]
MSQLSEEHFATNVYYDRTFDCDAAKILPGEFYFTHKDMLIVTVLGSCVSACIRDRVSGVGGMNHFMLPDTGGDPDNPVSASMRYGTYAMEVLINELLKAGAKRENLEAKVFGGGNVLRGFTAINVGERNAKFVLDYLRAERMRVIAEDLNDIYPRKVYFFPKTGKVLVKKLKVE